MKRERRDEAIGRLHIDFGEAFNARQGLGSERSGRFFRMRASDWVLEQHMKQETF